MTKNFKVVFFFLAALSAVFFGLASLVLLNLVGEHYAYLLSLPIFFVIGLLFLADRHLFFVLVVVTRASLDLPFDSIKLGNFGLGAVLNLLVILIAVLTYLENKSSYLKSFNDLRNAWMLFLLLSLLSIFYAPSFVPSLKVALIFVSYFSMFMLGLSVIKSEEDFGKWMKVIIFSSIIPVCYGIYCLAFGGHGVRFSVQEGLRVQSTFTHPNALAFYMSLIISICFYLMRTKPIYLQKYFINALPTYILLLVVVLLMTKTRSAWIACYIFFFLYCLLFERKLLLLVILGPFAALLIPEIQERILDLQKGGDYGSLGYTRLNSFAWRLQIWINSINWMSPMHYLWGYGVSSFAHYSPSFNMANAFEKMKNEINAHSVYVQLFFELGILGLLSFIYLLLMHIKRIFVLYKIERPLVFTIILILVEYLFESSSDNMLDYLIYEWYLWFFIGISLAYLLNIKSNEEINKNPLKTKVIVI